MSASLGWCLTFKPKANYDRLSSLIIVPFPVMDAFVFYSKVQLHSSPVHLITALVILASLSASWSTELEVSLMANALLCACEKSNPLK